MLNCHKASTIGLWCLNTFGIGLRHSTGLDAVRKSAFDQHFVVYVYFLICFISAAISMVTAWLMATSIRLPGFSVVAIISIPLCAYQVLSMGIFCLDTPFCMKRKFLHGITGTGWIPTLGWLLGCSSYFGGNWFDETLLK